ncbi:reverse transcriptase domain-containing protein [Tanacetum coccineum]
MFFYLTTLNLARFLNETAPQVEPPKECQPSNAQVVQAVEAWKHPDCLCHNYVLNGLVDSLYNVYCKTTTTKELWELLECKYKTEDAGTIFGVPPFLFNYPARRLTMEEMLAKFINEGKRKHEEMEIFIKEFRTTNELLLKEQSNLLSELKIKVKELSKVMGNVLIQKNEVKGVTTREGKMTFEATRNKEINETGINKNEPPRFEQDVQEKPHDVGVKNKSSSIPERTTQPLVKSQQSSIHFPNRVRKEQEEAHQRNFLENLKQLHINIPFIEALVQMPKYAKYLKNSLTNKSRLEEACTVTMNERCSVVLLNKLPAKEKDPGSFTIPCQVSNLKTNALADLGASISLMPYTMYENLGLGEPTPTQISLELADRSIQYPRRIVKNVHINVDKLVLPVDFVILDMPEDSTNPIILGRPFLATARAMIDVFNKKITLS